MKSTIETSEMTEEQEKQYDDILDSITDLMIKKSDEYLEGINMDIFATAMIGVLVNAVVINCASEKTNPTKIYIEAGNRLRGALDDSLRIGEEIVCAGELNKQKGSNNETTN